MQVRLAASCQLAKRSLAWPRWHISAGRACLRQFEAQLNFFRPLQVQVRAFADRTFEFDVKTPRTSYFLKKAAGLEKGATTPGTQIAGRLSLKDIYEIAKVRASPQQTGASVWETVRAGTYLQVGCRIIVVKYTDPQISRSMTLEGICRSIAAQCKSMGIVVYDPRQEKSS
eukprot:scaffold28342_cov31-Tisochrysis_lutea.AAC.1